MNNRSFFRYVGGFLILVVTFSILAWLVLYYIVGPAPKAPKDEMLIELSKVLAQLVFISLVGATATFLYNEYAKDHDRYKNKLQEENKNRRDLLDALINVRAEVEKGRRSYRLTQLQNAKDGYRWTVESLLQARLELSQVWHDILTLQQLYPGDSDAIQSGLTGMKIYLDNLIDEYETNVGKIDKLKDEEATRYIAELPRFGEFVAKDGGEAYTKDFLERNYRNSARLMRQRLLSLEE
jgi:hypothetical protein